MATANVAGAADLAAVAAELGSLGAHAIFLQEISRFTGRRLARLLGMHAAGGGRVAGRSRNAVLLWSRPSAVRVVRLPVRETSEPRTAVLARAGGITFVSTHLALSAADRAAQARALLAALEREPGPVVIGADLNEPPGGDAAALLESRFTRAGAQPTYPAEDPVAAIDAIFVSDTLTISSCAVAPQGSSDHRAVVAVLRRG